VLHIGRPVPCVAPVAVTGAPSIRSADPADIVGGAPADSLLTLSVGVWRTAQSVARRNEIFIVCNRWRKKRHCLDMYSR
jgi:hypothetical protein